MFQVVVTPEAEQDIQQNYEWWRDNRSPDQAREWYERILVEMQTLRHMPERYSTAPEAAKISRNIRQLFFTIGRRITHRVVFLIEAETVKVLRVRHVAQDALPDDFADPKPE